MIRLSQGRDAFDMPVMGALPQSDTIYAIVLVANTSQQISVSAGANFVLITASGGTDVYMKFTGSAISVPGANITDGTSPELICPLDFSCFRAIRGGSISLVSGTGCNVSLAFYA